MRIYRSFAAYPGELIATKDQDGVFQSDFAIFPGDEIVTVWVESDDDTFEPESFNRRHYYDFEVRTLNFTPTPVWRLFLLVVAVTG